MALGLSHDLGDFYYDRRGLAHFLQKKKMDLSCLFVIRLHDYS